STLEYSHIGETNTRLLNSRSRMVNESKRCGMKSTLLPSSLLSQAFGDRHVREFPDLLRYGRNYWDLNSPSKTLSGSFRRSFGVSRACNLIIVMSSAILAHFQHP